MDAVPVELLTMAAHELVHSSAKTVDFLFYKVLQPYDYDIKDIQNPPIVEFCNHYNLPAVCLTDRTTGVRYYRMLKEENVLASTKLLYSKSLADMYLKSFLCIKGRKSIPIALASFKKTGRLNNVPTVTVETLAKSAEPREVVLDTYVEAQAQASELSMLGYRILMGFERYQATEAFFTDTCFVSQYVVKDPEERRRALWYNVKGETVDSAKLEDLTQQDIPDDVKLDRAVAFPTRVEGLANFSLRLELLDLKSAWEIQNKTVKPSNYDLIDLGNYWRDTVIPESARLYGSRATCFMLYKASIKQRRTK